MTASPPFITKNPSRAQPRKFSPAGGQHTPTKASVPLRKNTHEGNNSLTPGRVTAFKGDSGNTGSPQLCGFGACHPVKKTNEHETARVPLHVNPRHAGTDAGQHVAGDGTGAARQLLIFISFTEQYLKIFCGKYQTQVKLRLVLAILCRMCYPNKCAITFDSFLYGVRNRKGRMRAAGGRSP